MITWLMRFSLRTRTLLLVLSGLTVTLAATGFLGVRALQESTDRVLAERLRLAELTALHKDGRVAEALTLLERTAASGGYDLTDARRVYQGG